MMGKTALSFLVYSDVMMNGIKEIKSTICCERYDVIGFVMLFPSSH